MTQTRRMQVLRAVVEDYIRSQEPIGSSALIAHHDLHVSSATIRKDMAALEDEGYLTQPHTSAGRIPTERGYRYFVDSLSTVMALSPDQRAALQALLDESVSLQDALQRSARLLSQITGQVAVVASPSLSKTHVWHLELIPISSVTLLAVVVTDTGRVAQQVLSVSHIPSPEHIQQLCDMINTRCGSMTLQQAASVIRTMPVGEEMEDVQALPALIAQIFTSMVDEEHAHELFMAGVSTLAHQHNATRDLTPLFDALEEQASIMHVMSQLSEAPQTDGVGIAIGSETHTPELIHASIVSSGYGKIDRHTSSGNTRIDEPIAFVGSIGPTHMNYEVAIAAVHAVATYLSTLISRHGLESPEA